MAREHAEGVSEERAAELAADAKQGPPDWWSYGDDHPGWRSLLGGMAEVAAKHGQEGHECRQCAPHGGPVRTGRP